MNFLLGVLTRTGVSGLMFFMDIQLKNRLKGMVLGQFLEMPLHLAFIGFTTPRILRICIRGLKGFDACRGPLPCGEAFGRPDTLRRCLACFWKPLLKKLLSMWLHLERPSAVRRWIQVRDTKVTLTQQPVVP